METYTKAQIIEIIYRQQGDDESLIKRLSERVAKNMTEEQLFAEAKKNGIPLKELGYNRYYFA
jgi:hypothetical protein